MNTYYKVLRKQDGKLYSVNLEPGDEYCVEYTPDKRIYPPIGGLFAFDSLVAAAVFRSQLQHPDPRRWVFWLVRGERHSWPERAGLYHEISRLITGAHIMDYWTNIWMPPPDLMCAPGGTILLKWIELIEEVT